MNSRIPISSKMKKQIMEELHEEFEEQYMAGQKAQRDIDLLVLHLTFGFGAKRLNDFNEISNEIVEQQNQWIKDDPKDGAKIARERLKQELEKIQGIMIGD